MRAPLLYAHGAGSPHGSQALHMSVARHTLLCVGGLNAVCNGFKRCRTDITQTTYCTAEGLVEIWCEGQSCSGGGSFACLL